MANDNKTPGYSQLVGCVYIFNLIVGTGVLTLPKAFQEAGLLFSGIILTSLCFLSYISATYVVEAMSLANGITKLKQKCKLKSEKCDSKKLEVIFETSETQSSEKENEVNTDKNKRSTNSFKEISLEESKEALIEESYFEITEIFEMGQMAILFFNKFGLMFFYLCMCVYLYGDLAIYSAAVATTMRDVTCTFKINSSNQNLSNGIMNSILKDSDPCWNSLNLSRLDAYRILLALFATVSCPFVFLNLTKTKIIQYITIAMRWMAFGIMFSLMSIYLATGNKYGEVRLADLTKSPNLLGVCIYSFMCHHSLPSLITPLKKKKNIFSLFFINFVIILLFYMTLSVLSSFTFVNINSLVSLNFQPSSNPLQPSITNIAFFQYYLSLYPVFAISASFPIIGITLRNNLKNLINCGTSRTHDIWFMEKMFYPLLALIPPLLVVFVNSNVTFLVGFTGSYAGTFIQYVIPTCLVICSKNKLKVFKGEIGSNSLRNNGVTDGNMEQIHQSPFKSKIFYGVVLVWSGVSIIFVTINHFLQ